MLLFPHLDLFYSFLLYVRNKCLSDFNIKDPANKFFVFQEIDKKKYLGVLLVPRSAHNVFFRSLIQPIWVSE